MEKIVIFCSASECFEAKYKEAAVEVVRGLCEKGYGIVSGGSFRGMMGTVADTVKACGGYHKGVIPEFMDRLVYDGLSETVWAPSMSVRKELMRRGTIAAIALPGGIGTLDELIETQVLIKLKQYHGRLAILNYDGFYEPFKDLLDHYVSTGMLTAEDRDIAEIFDTPRQLLESF